MKTLTGLITEPSRQLAAHLTNAVRNSSHETVHPAFGTYLAHAALEGAGYVRASKNDHAPLTDLRLRRDESSRDLFVLNVQALVASDPGLVDVIESVAALSGEDFSLRHLRSELGGTGERSNFVHEIDRLLRENPGAVVSLLIQYVNIFGSWADAELIARKFALAADSLGENPLRWSLSGYAAVVLGLSGDDDYRDLFQAAIDNHPDPIESFFAGLRWASIEAKRRGDLNGAGQIIDHAAEVALGQVLDARDQSVIRAMRANFKGLLAVRAKDFALASRLVNESLDAFGSNPANTDRVLPEEAVRYAWMARVNRAQLLLYSGRNEGARDELRDIVEFAREFDPGALHSSLSMLAFSLIQGGNPGDAIDVLIEALELLRIEYDAKVVVQVRKMLFRACVELGRERSAELIRRDDLYYWRSPNVAEKYDLVH